MHNRLRKQTSLAILNAPPSLDSPFSTPALTYASSTSANSPAPSMYAAPSTSSSSFASYNPSLTGRASAVGPLRRQQSLSTTNTHPEFLPDLPQRTGSWHNLESSLPDTSGLAPFPSATTSRSKPDYGSFTVLDGLPPQLPLSTPQRGIRRSASSTGLSTAASQWQLTANQQPIPTSRRSSPSSSEEWNTSTPLDSLSPPELAPTTFDSGFQSSMSPPRPSEMPTSGLPAGLSISQRTAASHPRSRAARAAMEGGLNGFPNNQLQDPLPTLTRKPSFAGLSSCIVPEPTSAQYSSTFVPGRAPPSPADLRMSGSTYSEMPSLPMQNGRSLRPVSPSPMRSMPALRSNQGMGSARYPDLSMGGSSSMGFGGMPGYDSMDFNPNPRIRKVSRKASLNNLSMYGGGVSYGGSLSQYEGSGWR